MSLKSHRLQIQNDYNLSVLCKKDTYFMDLHRSVLCLVSIDIRHLRFYFIYFSKELLSLYSLLIPSVFSK